MHSANNFFKDGRAVCLDDFVEFHTFISSQIERDCEFRNFMIGVWSMDTMENLMPAKNDTTYYSDQTIAGKRAVAYPAVNSRE
jgi:hypothetical protein